MRSVGKTEAERRRKRICGFLPHSPLIPDYSSLCFLMPFNPPSSNLRDITDHVEDPVPRALRMDRYIYRGQRARCRRSYWNTTDSRFLDGSSIKRTNFAEAHLVSIRLHSTTYDFHGHVEDFRQHIRLQKLQQPSKRDWGCSDTKHSRVYIYHEYVSIPIKKCWRFSCPNGVCSNDLSSSRLVDTG